MANKAINESTAFEEFNSLTSIDLCIQGQELVQDIISKIHDCNTNIKQVSNYVTNVTQDPYMLRKQKLEEYLQQVDTLFMRLKVACKIINQRLNDLNSQQFTSDTSQQQIDHLKQQQAYLHQQIREKNDYIKIAIDNLYSIIWQINAMESIKSIK